MAVAGIERLGLSSRICEVLDENMCVPAAGQGAIGIEIRKDSDEIKELVVSINDEDTFACVSSERRVALELDASCDLPIGIFASVSGNKFSLRVFISDSYGKKIIRESISGSYKNIREITGQLLTTLRDKGSKEIIIKKSG